MNKLVRWSFLLGIVVVWTTVLSIDMSTWPNEIIVLVECVIPTFLTALGLYAFIKWDKIIKAIASDEKADNEKEDNQ